MCRKCLRCKTTDSLTVHHVVPEAFTKFFPPEVYRYDSGDDLAVLCEACHTTYERRANSLKLKLFREAGVGDSIPPHEAIKESIRKKAKALQRHQARETPLPNEVAKTYEQDIIDYLGELDLDQATSLRAQASNQFVALVNMLTDYEAFADTWRQDFQKFLKKKRK